MMVDKKADDSRKMLFAVCLIDVIGLLVTKEFLTRSYQQE